jgi:hypothetical protein
MFIVGSEVAPGILCQGPLRSFAALRTRFSSAKAHFSYSPRFFLYTPGQRSAMPSAGCKLHSNRRENPLEWIAAAQ